jgi:hypothetical protein
MKRLLPAVALALALAAPASAKEVTSLTVCGTNGCHKTKDKDALRSLMEVQPQPTPDHSGAFLRVRSTVRAPGQHDSGVMRSQWIPSLGLMRHDDGAMTEFTLPYPTTMRTLNRLSDGLTPYPARPIRQRTARVAEVVPPPQRDDEDGGAVWALSALAILPAGLVFVMRRRGRWN